MKILVLIFFSGLVVISSNSARACSCRCEFLFDEGILQSNLPVDQLDDGIFRIRFLWTHSFGDLCGISIQADTNKQHILHAVIGNSQQPAGLKKLERIISETEFLKLKDAVEYLNIWSMPSWYEETKKAKRNRQKEKLLNLIGLTISVDAAGVPIQKDGSHYILEVWDGKRYHAVHRQALGAEAEIDELCRKLILLSGVLKLPMGKPHLLGPDFHIEQENR